MANEPFHAGDSTTCDEDAVLGGVKHLNARRAGETSCELSSELLGMEDSGSFGKLSVEVEEFMVEVYTKGTGSTAGGCVIAVKPSVSFGAMADEVKGLGIRVDLGCIDIDWFSM
ncbi:hypothetical protein APSETT444_008520 [Aspergillus pseudonomiae]